MTNDTDDGPDGAAAAAVTNEQSNRKGNFEFPDNAVDLIGMMLDPDIRAARDKVHRQIENGAVGQSLAGGRGIQNRGLTQGAQVVAKAVTDIHAVQKQAQRNQAQRR